MLYIGLKEESGTRHIFPEGSLAIKRDPVGFAAWEIGASRRDSIWVDAVDVVALPDLAQAVLWLAGEDLYGLPANPSSGDMYIDENGTRWTAPKDGVWRQVWDPTSE